MRPRTHHRPRRPRHGAQSDRAPRSRTTRNNDAPGVTLGSYDVAVSIPTGAVPVPPDGAERWLDDAPVGEDWAAPTPPGRRRSSGRRVPAAVVYGAVLLALVLIVVAIWGLGGLRQRTDVFRNVPVGSLVSTGPYVLSFTEATAQLTTDFDDTSYWKVTVIGSGRSTATKTMAPTWSGDESMFLAKDDASQELELPTSTSFGGVDALLDRDAFTPGLAPILYAVTFKFHESYRPGATLRFVAYDLDFYDNSLLGDGDKAWHNDNSGSRMFLPVRVLPKAK